MPTDTPTTEARPTQTLNLTPQQLNHLKQHRSLWVWVPMKEQPIEVGGSLAMPIRGIAARGYRPFKESDYPFRLGDRVGIKEATRVLSFGACVAEVLYLSDGDRKIIPDRGFPNRCGDVSADKMPNHAIRTFATLATSPEPRRLDSITEDEAEAAGVEMFDYERGSNDVVQVYLFSDSYPGHDSARSAMREHYTSTHPDLTPSSYGWWFKLEMGS